MTRIKKQKQIMLEKHLKGRGITDEAVLRAMAEVPREAFVPESQAEYAYQDSPLPIGEGQTISQPYIVAAMTQFLELKRHDRVLEIGTGSGYAVAILSRIVDSVFTVERYRSLSDRAVRRLTELGYDNIVFMVGDGTLGWPEHAPYDAIVVTAGAPEVPRPLKEQLAVGGRLVIPAGSRPMEQELIRIRRVSEVDYEQEFLAMVRFVPLVGEAGWPQ